MAVLRVTSLSRGREDIHPGLPSCALVDYYVFGDEYYVFGQKVTHHLTKHNPAP